MVMKQLYINGVGTGQFDIYISSDTFLNSPEIAYEAYEVPGLDGSLLKYDKRLNNVSRRFDCFCKTNVDANIDAFKKLLYTNRGYMRIESDYEPDVYQYGYLAEGIEFQPFDASGAYEVQFSIYFSCKPQKYFISNDSIDVRHTKSLGAVESSYGVYTKNSEFMQRLFSQIPIEYVPDDELYVVLQPTYEVSKSSSSLVTMTSTATDGFSIFVRNNSNTSKHTVLAYGIPNISKTVAKGGAYDTEYLVVSVSKDTVYSLTIVNNTSGSSYTDTFGPVGYVYGEISVNNSIGLSPILTMSIGYDTHTDYSEEDSISIIFSRKYSSSNEVATGFIYQNFYSSVYQGFRDIMSSFGYTKSGYSNRLFLDIVYDSSVNTFKIGDFDISKYFEVNGNDMAGTGDYVYLAYIESGNRSPLILTVSATPEAWKV